MMQRSAALRRCQAVSLLTVGYLLCTGPTVRVFGAAPSPAKVDFVHDIRPILSDNCFKCHGPDEQERKAGLRLDQQAEALKPAKSGDRAIVPRDLAASALIRRITAKDEDDVMPPPKTGKKLSAQQIDSLRRWIEQGAEYRDHWAYTPPRRPDPPPVRNPRAVRNEIDRFVLARLERERLKPAPEADKPTLARRASLDLTGLPPTVAEVDAFLADKSPQAYEKLVDRLLAAPQYGEHMARYWMDAARYADSHGYHIDSERSLWKWRDWVVDAFNQNVPFDQFTTEQLAGDLLPKATMEQKIASGYLRSNMSTGEGGAIEEEYQAKYTFDRLETTSTIWLGLTMTCARCHTHKYDPISQREYYGLYAFFNSLNESVMDGNRPNPDPFIKVPSPAQARRLDELRQYVTEGKARIDAPWPGTDAALTNWVTSWRQRFSPTQSSFKLETARSLATNGPTLRMLDDGSVLAEGGNPEKDVHELTGRVAGGTLAALRVEVLPDPSLPQQAAGRADDGGFRLSGFEAEWLDQSSGASGRKVPMRLALADSAAGGAEADKAIDGKADTGWAVDLKQARAPHAIVFVTADPSEARDGLLRVRLRFEGSKARETLGRYRLTALAGTEAVQAFHPPKPSPWKTLGPLPAVDQKTGFATAYEPESNLDLSRGYPGVREEVRWQEHGDFGDGRANLLVPDLHGVHGVYYLVRSLRVDQARPAELSLRADGLFKLWVNGQLVAERAFAEKPGDGPARATVKLSPGDNRILAKIVTVQGAAHFTFNQDLAALDAPPAEVIAALLVAPTDAAAATGSARTFHHRLALPAFRDLFDRLAAWREEEAAIDREVPTTMVAREQEKPRETLLLMRGEYDKKGEKILPGVPSILPPFPKDAPTNRLGLARWLLDPAHPLTARVTVNRFWQQYFGVGLVKTAEDFGVQGEQPSHPELLDWLATEFVRSGWNVKHLQRLIVTSATYRQSSRAAPELWTRDPENRLLARGPRFRLDGEVVRDTALALGGLLVDRRGGRSVKPYEPPGLWEAVSYNNAQKYVPDTGDGQYRRSLYTYWKRQSPPPNMLIFDSPTREYCVVRRPRTNTPLQALILLNDPQFVEAARAFGQRIMLEGGKDPSSRARYGFKLATGRQPAAAEMKVLLDVFERQWADFKTNRSAADQFLTVGSFKAKDGLEPTELAAWATVAGLLLNLDETLTKG